MRDPGPGSEFTPAELDLLEDALEWVGDPTRHAELAAMPAPLRQRAEEYASILALSREAMPEEDVPPGLLDGILAEARRAAPGPAPVAEGPSFWERLRRSFLLPGLALAGTAALLLWVARPNEEVPSVFTEQAAPAPKPTPAPAAEARASQAPADGAELEDMAPESYDSKDRQAEAAPREEEEAAGAAVAEPAGAPKAAAARTKPKKEAAEALPLPGLDVAEAARVDADKDSVRDQLESGDRARRKGRCDVAEAEYAAVARSTGPAAERARALAGLGLCRAADGKSADAERYFAEARALDPSVSRWLANEQAGSLKKSKAATKASADEL